MRRKLLLSLPAILLLLLAGVWLYANHKARSLVDVRIADFLESGDYRNLDYDSLFVNWNGDVTLKDLHVIDVAGNEFILRDIRLSDLDYRHEVPYHLSLAARGIRFPAGIPNFGNNGNLSLNNYLETVMDGDYLPLEVNYRYEYLPEDNSRLDSTLSFSLADSFHLTSVSVMKNVPLQALNENPLGPAMNPARLSPLMQDAEIPEATMSLHDLGMVNAMMDIQGEQNGISADEYRSRLIGRLQSFYLFVPQQLQALALDFTDKFSQFLEGEKTLQMSVTPEYGGSVRRLQSEVMSSIFIGDYNRIADLLNLKIETL